MLTKRYYAFFLLLFILSCGREAKIDDDNGQELSIFFINDPHSRLANFAKIKHIVDQAKTETNVLLVAGGDLFSGSPYVDQYEQKGYPIIDVMNRTGFDITVIGNHEFDYGLDVLNDRISQAEFDWVCANVDTQSSDLAQPDPYKTLTIAGIKVTFLGLVETKDRPSGIIPATHPWKVTEVSFQHAENVVDQYAELKKEEESDVYIALTHLGLRRDQELARNAPYFDLIIGGHTNDKSVESVNGIPTLMAGNNLSHLGRVDLTVNNREVTIVNAELIDLSTYPDSDEKLAAVIAKYQNNPAFEEVIGTAETHHDRSELGCFYTTALLNYMEADISFQNGGGIRDNLDEGEITTFEIYSIDPFNNGSVIFTKTVREIKDFFIDTGEGLHVSGVEMVREGDDIIMKDEEGNVLSDEMELKVGINDFMPAIYTNHFDIEDADIQELTTAETMIQYLKTMDSTVDFEGCNQYFRYEGS